MKSIRCPSCNQNYNDNLNKPMLIKCGHSVCQNCLNQKIKLNSNNRVLKHKPYKCLTCKADVLNIEDATVNASLLELYTEVSK